MAKTTIRLPDGLALEAQERADWLGLSFNGLVAVALDAYLGRDRVRPAAPEGDEFDLDARANRAEFLAGRERIRDKLTAAGESMPVAASVPAADLLPAGLTRQQRRQWERDQAKGKP